MWLPNKRNILILEQVSVVSLGAWVRFPDPSSVAGFLMQSASKSEVQATNTTSIPIPGALFSPFVSH